MSRNARCDIQKTAARKTTMDYTDLIEGYRAIILSISHNIVSTVTTASYNCVSVLVAIRQKQRFDVV